jgi:hypothetical protein
VCDWNEDGYLDLVTGERNGYFSLFLRLANGELTDAGRIKAHGVDIVADMNSWPFICDWDEDGKKDLLCGQSGIGAPCNAYYYRNDGFNATPIFNDSTPVLVWGNPITCYRSIPVLADLDVDGKKDLILGEWYSSVRFYTNVGTHEDPVFQDFIFLVDPDSQSFLNGNPPRVNFTDWDGDFDLDMITACYYGWVYLHENITPSGVSKNPDQILNPTQFTISPNPFATGTHFELLGASLKYPVDLRIFDISGKLISSRSLAASSSYLGTDLKAGIYFIEVDGNPKQKIIKIK